MIKIEIRSDSEMHISGYVNAVERDSRELDASKAEGATSPFVEQVMAGAWQRAIDANPSIKLRYNHSVDIGGTAEGTLRLKEDNIGLHADARISDPEVIRAARHGRLTGWSFGFRNAKAKWETTSEGKQRRKLTDFDLDEVSILSVEPAYIGTSIEARDNMPGMEIRAVSDKSELLRDDCEVEMNRLKNSFELLKLKSV